MKIGTRIRAERVRCKLTQRQLAKAIDVSNDVISKYERDVIQPSVARLSALAKTFGITMDALCGAKAA